MMTPCELRNVLAILRSIDRHEIEACCPVLSDKAWIAFRDNPFEAFLRVDDTVAAAITAAVNKRLGNTGVAA